MSSQSSLRRVAIFGGSKCEAGDDAWEESERLGRLIAEAGWGVVTGGYGGVMEAASKGAASAGGEVVGVLCKLFGSVGNPHLTRRIVTPDLYSRLRELIELGDAYVVMPGSTGTLVELTMVWELMNKRLISLRPIYCLGSYWRPVITMFAEDLTHDPRVRAMGLPDRVVDLITLVETPAALIDSLSGAWAQEA